MDAYEIKRRKERSRLIYIMFESMNNGVFESQKIQKLKALADIALENQQILNSMYPAFMFEGIWYTYPYNANTGNMSSITRTLDISLIRKVVDIVHGDCFEHKIAAVYITNLINGALGICNRLHCIKKLIPSEVWEPMYTFLTKRVSESELMSVIDIGEELTEEEINQFKEQNKQGYDALKHLYMTELLLAKVDT